MPPACEGELELAARILIIEDNPANMELMAYLLKAFGHVPLCSCDGEEGLAIARREQPDLIICDVQLPKLDGCGVVSFLKRHPGLRAVPVVAVTALAMAGDREKLLAVGFDRYISKPIDPETFVGLIESMLPADRAAITPGDAQNLQPPSHH